MNALNADTDTEMSVIYAGNRCMKNSEKRRKKQMAKPMNETQKRVRVIEKLISLGITDEENVKIISASRKCCSFMNCRNR